MKAKKFKKLTEKEAWKILGDAFSTPKNKRTELQKNLAKDGICCAIDEYFLMSDSIISTFSEFEWNENDWAGALTRRNSNKMINKIKPCVPDWKDYFLETSFKDCSTSRQADKLRADFCYLMYYECGGE